MLKLLLAALVAGVILAGCSNSRSNEQFTVLDVRLAVVQSLSGDGAVYGRSGVEGIELAIKELEASTPGLRVQYTIVDDESSVEAGIAAYEAVAAEQVTAIIGPSLSRIGFPALKVAQDAGIPAISPMTTASGIGEIGQYVFRIALAEDASLPALIERVSEATPISTAVLFFDSADAYSRSGAEAMRAGTAAIGGRVALEVDLAHTALLEDVLDAPEIAAADAFLIPAFTETAAPVLRALRTAGLTQPVIGGEAMASLDLARLAGDAVEGTYVASTWHPDSSHPLSRRFVDAYVHAYGHTPEHFAAESYTAVYVLVDALQRASSTDPVRVREALAATRGLDTVLGSLSISPTGDAAFSPVFQQFRNGALVLLP